MFLASPITFPNLGITVDPDPVAFTVFGKSIYWYGIIIAAGFLLAVLYMMHRAKDFGITQDDVLDMVLWAVPIGVICARAYYCIFYWELYRDDPISVLYIWEGGLAIYGGILGGAIALLLFCAVRHMPLLQLADVLVPALALGQGIGRWGNYFNMEAYGRLITNPQWQFFPAAVLIPVDSGYEWHMATFFYESCVDVLIFLVLWFGVRKRKRWNGQLLAVYMLMYGIGRAAIEGLRMDSLYSGSIRISQIVSITLAAVGLIWLLIGTFARKNPQREG